MEAELEKLEYNLGGVRDMKRLPQAALIIDLKTEAIAVAEAERLRDPDHRPGRLERRPERGRLPDPRQRRLDALVRARHRHHRRAVEGARNNWRARRRPSAAPRRRRSAAPRRRRSAAARRRSARARRPRRPPRGGRGGRGRAAARRASAAAGLSRARQAAEPRPGPPNAQRTRPERRRQADARPRAASPDGGLRRRRQGPARPHRRGDDGLQGGPGGVRRRRRQGDRDPARQGSGLGREAQRARRPSEGVVASYIHAGGKVGVLVEVQCETDFVARTDDFQEFAREVAIHIAALNPQLRLDRRDPRGRAASRAARVRGEGARGGQARGRGREDRRGPAREVGARRSSCSSRSTCAPSGTRARRSRSCAPSSPRRPARTSASPASPASRSARRSRA